MKAALHPNQTERLAALRNYDILDTPREGDFDDVVALAAAVCGAPISVVNLIDAERQWFKAEVGLGVRETPLETSICSHAILEREFLEIEDTLLDGRMAGNELVTGDPGLRFYAGALLRTPEGLPLGTLCVLDYKPRTLTPLQRQTLRVLARQVMSQLNLRLALKHQTLLGQEIDHRVKNSLQTVSSLVALQRGKSSDPVVRAALEAVAQRIRTISLLHEELYQASMFDVVDLGHYLARLRDLLQRNTPETIRITLDTRPVRVVSRHASAIGMIVSEFVANSIKHAFPANRDGVITLTLRPIENGEIELICQDNGVGAPPGMSATAATGLGMRIIDASASQLAGRIEYASPAQGYGFRINFPAT